MSEYQFRAQSMHTSSYLHRLNEAYQFKGERPAFEQRFKRFVAANSSHKALLAKNIVQF